MTVFSTPKTTCLFALPVLGRGVKHRFDRAPTVAVVGMIAPLLIALHTFTPSLQKTVLTYLQNEFFSFTTHKNQ
jgi:hypothetical protein